MGENINSWEELRQEIARVDKENASLNRVAEKLCEFILSYTDCQRCPVCDLDICDRGYFDNRDCTKTIIDHYRKECAKS